MVNVWVIVAVSVAVRSGVSVKAGADVRVNVKVEEGDSGTVAVGAGAANTIPPQAKTKTPPNISRIIFFISPIKFPDDPQPIEGEPWGDDVDDLGFFRDDFCQPASSDDFHIASQLRLEPVHHSLDHADVAKEES